MKTSRAAETANRIVVMTAFFKLAMESIPTYLLRKGPTLFSGNSSEVASTLTILLNEINRTVRLSAYLCTKGVFPQAVTVMRGALELIGLYTHVWHQPQKARFVADSDSEDHALAFRRAADKSLRKRLTMEGVRFRFMFCRGGKEFSKLYTLLSAHFVHGFIVNPVPSDVLSCEFVDRSTPDQLQTQYQLIQTLLTMLLMELIQCIPEEDLLDDEVGAFTIGSLLFLPTLAGFNDPESNNRVNDLLEALRQSRSRSLKYE